MKEKLSMGYVSNKEYRERRSYIRVTFDWPQEINDRASMYCRIHGVRLRDLMMKLLNDQVTDEMGKKYAKALQDLKDASK